MPISTDSTSFLTAMRQVNTEVLSGNMNHPIEISCGGFSFTTKPFHILSTLPQEIETLKKIVKIVDVNEKDSQGRTPLYYAAYSGHIAAMKVLLENGADFSNTNAKEQSVAFALAEAEDISRGNYIDIVVELLTSGYPLNLNEHNKEGFTPLHTAAEHENRIFITIVKEFGHHLDDQENEKRKTPLHVAVLNQSLGSVDVLLALGADYYLEDREGVNPFVSALATGNLDLVEMFITHDPTIIEEIDVEGETQQMDIQGKADFAVNKFRTLFSL